MKLARGVGMDWAYLRISLRSRQRSVPVNYRERDFAQTFELLTMSDIRLGFQAIPSLSVRVIHCPVSIDCQIISPSCNTPEQREFSSSRREAFLERACHAKGLNDDLLHVVRNKRNTVNSEAAFYYPSLDQQVVDNGPDTYVHRQELVVETISISICRNLLAKSESR